MYENLFNIGEDRLNFLMFLAGMIISIEALIVVVGVLHGSSRDYSVLLVTGTCILIRTLELKIKRFERYVKYAYMIVPFMATCAIIICNDGQYAAVTQFYFTWLLLSVAYCNAKVVIVCSAVTIISTLGGLLLFPEAMLKLDNYTIWFFIFTLYVVTSFLAVFIAKRMRGLIEKAHLIKTYDDELAYLKQLEKKDEKHSEFIHNINHYFNVIGELAGEQHCEQIVNLIREMNVNIIQNERIIYTKHRVANAILSETIAGAKERGVDFDVYIEPGVQFGQTADGDLVAMLGNLLDNAVESAEKCAEGNRSVNLRIYMEKDGKVCVIKIANHFTQKPIPHKSGFKSLKKGKGLHGYGIKSVENIAEKYNGYLQCLVEDQLFTAILILSVAGDKN